MARELSQETRDIVLRVLREEPYATATKLTSLSYLYEYEKGKGMKYMEIYALIKKEMDRAKKKIKKVKDDLIIEHGGKCKRCKRKVKFGVSPDYDRLEEYGRAIMHGGEMHCQRCYTHISTR